MKLTGGSLSPGLPCPPRYLSVPIDFEHPTTDANPERPSAPSSAEGTSGAEGFLSFPPPSLTPFRMNTQHPAKDADPERPSGAEGFLPLSLSLPFPSSSLTPFRMNTYRKQGEGGGYRVSRHLCFTVARNRAQRTLCFQPLAHSLHTLSHRAASHLLLFQWFTHSLPKHGGCTPIILYPEGFFRGTKPQFMSSLRLPLPYVLSFLCGLCGLCASVATLFFLFWPAAELTLALNRSTLEMTP